MEFAGETITIGTVFFLVFAVGLELFFEAINGFHDTANAVATVIYTHSLKPTYAVVWSGICNLLGVLVSSGAVAFTIVALLPNDLVTNVGSSPSYAMIFSVLIAAIIWNFGTWYLGIPNSSTHALTGSLLGVSLAHALLSPSHNINEGMHWDAVKDVLLTLLISPIIGFVCAGLLLLLAKTVLRRPEFYEPADQRKAPPAWIRGLLILTCTGVSFAHGNNDGQKGMGLFTLILIAILPGVFALNLNTNAAVINGLVNASRSATPVIEQRAHGISLNSKEASSELSSFLNPTGKVSDRAFAALAEKNHEITNGLSGKTNFRVLSPNDRRSLRSDLYLVSSTLGKLNKGKQFTNPQEEKAVAGYLSAVDKEINYIPTFVKVAVAFALGVGTMIGWKRIVVTVGEKIGKTHLSYAEGASAEVVAMATIGAASGQQFSL